MNRVSFYVDGFNLYHSMLDIRTIHKKKAKWLDLRAFCESLIGNIAPHGTLESVHYFSAYASHYPSREADHRKYVECLRDQGVEIHMGVFKQKQAKCKGSCRQQYTVYEEKETDVRIALRFLEDAITGNIDTGVIVSGDTDLIPAISAARRLAPNVRSAVAFPFGRRNLYLVGAADTSIRLKSKRYMKHQMPNSVTLSTGKVITKPSNW